MTDFTYKAPSLAVIGTALTALQASGLVGPNDGPATMLGPLSVGKLFRYGIGRAAVNVTGPDGKPLTIPAAGTVGMFYIAIRADVGAPPFDPTTMGLVVTTPAESAAVLGVWA